MINEEHTESVQKVPFLGDIPLLGQLFRSTTVGKEKRNLMVFIHPTIIRDAALLDEISGEKYSFMREQQLAAQEKGISLLTDEEAAVLPSWNELEELPWRNK